MGTPFLLVLVGRRLDGRLDAGGTVDDERLGGGGGVEPTEGVAGQQADEDGEHGQGAEAGEPGSVEAPCPRGTARGHARSAPIRHRSGIPP